MATNNPNSIQAVADTSSLDFAKVVYFNNTDINAATIFDIENPPITNDNTLKNDASNLYIGTDGKTWVWNGSAYIAYTPPNATPFLIAGTTTDAGANKTANITRTGSVTIGANSNPLSKLDVVGDLTIGAGGIGGGKIKPRDNVGTLQLFGSQTDFNGAYFIMNSSSKGGQFLMTHGNFTGLAPASVFSVRYANNGVLTEQFLINSSGNAGIGTSSPTEKLTIAGALKISNGGYTTVTNGASTPVPAGGAGTIIFNGTNFFGWNGSAWKQLDN